MTITLRKAQENELDWINQKYEEVDFIPSHFASETIVIAEVDGVKAGLGRLVSVDNEYYELGGIYVFEQFRKLGLARQIVRFLLDQCPKGKTLYCIPFESLLSFYKSFGFSSCLIADCASPELQKKYLWCKKTYSENVVILKVII